jgi:glutathione synthase/RimK-type ligase-like ATP-grasp enzyme
MRMTNSVDGSSQLASDQRRPWIILGNPANRRVTLFQAVLRELRQPAAQVVSYVEYLRGQVDFDQLLARHSRENGILRIESPGEDHLVERLLLARGALGGAETTISAAKALRLRADPGRVRNPRQWFAGYSAALNDIEAMLRNHPGVLVQNPPREIRTLFDKPRCHAELSARGVSVPRALPPVGSYDELREAIRAAGLTRVFVKLAFGSSSSGVVAFNTGGTRPMAITSLELVRRPGEARFYNNLSMSRYDREHDLRTILDFLCREGVHVEEWLPKASQGDRNLDLRIVTIAGQARHSVVRTSRSPMTNLHLGNRRGDLAALQQVAGRRWQIVPELCEQAAQAFPAALYVGWDVLVTPGFRRAYILEGNAFGDLLPNVTYGDRSTYAQIVVSTLHQFPAFVA